MPYYGIPRGMVFSDLIGWHTPDETCPPVVRRIMADEEFLAAIVSGFESFERGEGIPAAEYFRKRFGR